MQIAQSSIEQKEPIRVGGLGRMRIWKVDVANLESFRMLPCRHTVKDVSE